MASSDDRPWDFDTDSDESDLELDHEELSPDDAAQLLFELLEDSFMSGEASAKTVAITAYYAVKAGVKGQIATIALPPGCHGQSYSRKVIRATGLDRADHRLQTIQVPGYSRLDQSRVMLALPVVPPHESFVDEVSRNPGMLQEIEELSRDSEWSESYRNHPAVTSDGPTTIPAALYVDGLPYSNSDGAIGFWLYSLTTRTRHLCVVIRKRHLCRCSCCPQGWCTIHAILAYLAWSLEALVLGRYPSRTHELKHWNPLIDPVRSRLAGREFGFRLAIVQIKADWAEWAHTLVFRAGRVSNFHALFAKLTIRTGMMLLE